MSRPIVISSVVVSLAVGATVVFSLYRPPPEIEPLEPGPVADGYILEAKPVTTGSSVDGYVKVTPAVVLAEGVSSAVLGDNLALVEAATLEVMLDFPTEDLDTPAGLDRLRAELTTAVAGVLGEDAVSRVIITDLVSQPPSD